MPSHPSSTTTPAKRTKRSRRGKRVPRYERLIPGIDRLILEAKLIAQGKLVAPIETAAERAQGLFHKLEMQEGNGAQLLLHYRDQAPLAPLPRHLFQPPPLFITNSQEIHTLHKCILGCGEMVEDEGEESVCHYSRHFARRAVENMGLGPHGKAEAVVAEVFEKETDEVIALFLARLNAATEILRYTCRRGCSGVERMTLEEAIFHNLWTHRQLQKALVADDLMRDKSSGFKKLYKRLFPQSRGRAGRIPWEQGLRDMITGPIDWQQILL